MSKFFSPEVLPLVGLVGAALSGASYCIQRNLRQNPDVSIDKGYSFQKTPATKPYLHPYLNNKVPTNSRN